MGVVANITADKFPKQSDKINRRVSVCYHLDISKCQKGIVVRDDIEAPHVTIFKLDNGRYVLATECQYAF